MSGKLRLPPHLAALNPHLAASREPLTVGDGYRSKLERRAATEWIPTVFKWWDYEAFTFNLPGHRYKPDFFGELLAGGLAVVEVKGHNPNIRADKVKFSNAAATHGNWLKFCWLTWDKRDGWIEEWR